MMSVRDPILFIEINNSEFIFIVGDFNQDKNLEFLNSPEARAIRILCEYEEPLRRFTQQNVQDTIVFFGSARSRPMDEVQAEIAQCKLELEHGQCCDRVQYGTII